MSDLVEKLARTADLDAPTRVVRVTADGENGALGAPRHLVQYGCATSSTLAWTTLDIDEEAVAEDTRARATDSAVRRVRSWRRPALILATERA